MYADLQLRVAIATMTFMVSILRYVWSAAVVAALLPFPAQATVSLTIRFGGAGDKVWIAAVPIDGRGAVASWDVPPGASEFRAAVERDKPILLCAGAPDRATSCRRLSPGQDSTEVFTLAVGREARGRCFLGRNAAAKAQLHLLFPGIQSRQPYAIPLGRREQKLVDSIQTDAEGRFTIAHLEPGTYALDIWLPNGRIYGTGSIVIPARRPSDGDTPVAIPDISIPPGVDIAVRVRTLTGEPVPKAGVSIWQDHDARDERPVIVQGNADRDGKIVLSGVDATLPLRLTCGAKGFLRYSFLFDVPPNEASCVLQKFASIRGQVHDDHGIGRAGATILLNGTSRRFTTDERGAFQIPNLAPADYDLRTTLAGYRTVKTGISVAAEENKDLGVIDLTPGDLIEGRVRNADNGMPVPNALVRIIDPLGAGEATSDETGAFSLTADATSSMAIEAGAPGFATVRQTRPGTTSSGELLIDLPQPGRLEVTVWDEEADTPCSTTCVVSVGLGETIPHARTDAAGVAVFDDLAPGNYRVTREFSSAGSGFVRVSGGGEWRTAVVNAHETTRVKIGEPATRITVTLSPAPPLSWHLRAACPPLITYATPDAPGTYVVRKRDSACTVSIFDSSRLLFIYVGTIPEDFHDTQFPISLATGGMTAAFKRAGAPLVGANVQLTSTNGQIVASATTAANGSVDIPFLGPGTYVIAADGIAERRTIFVPSIGIADAGTISAAAP